MNLKENTISFLLAFIFVFIPTIIVAYLIYLVTQAKPPEFELIFAASLLVVSIVALFATKFAKKESIKQALQGLGVIGVVWGLAEIIENFTGLSRSIVALFIFAAIIFVFVLRGDIKFKPKK